MLSFGIIKEGKIPSDARVPLTPEQCREIINQFSEVVIHVQKSNLRCFKDEEYRQSGISVRDNVEDCDILLGVKEVPISELIENKVYLFFSHTTKFQPYNRDLLVSILKKNIQLIDYETLVDERGSRVIAFGRYAGLVGAYNAIRAFSIRNKLPEVKPAHQCFDLAEAKNILSQLKLPPIKIAVNGRGRVGKGAMEILDTMKIKKVEKKDFLEKNFQEAVYVQLNSADYNRRKDGKPFDAKHFHTYPEMYKSVFMDFASHIDVLIGAAYWNTKAPKLFTIEEMKSENFKIRIIADITCDIEGSIPSTKRPSTIDEPFYDYNPHTDSLEKSFSDEKNVTVMAIDNLPSELPRDASKHFGQQLKDKVLPEILKGKESKMIERATITYGGALTSSYNYLKEFAGV